MGALRINHNNLNKPIMSIEFVDEDNDLLKVEFSTRSSADLFLIADKGVFMTVEEAIEFGNALIEFANQLKD